MAWTEADTPDGWRLEVFEDARGRFYPRRWIFASAEKVPFPIEVSNGLRNYAFATSEAAIDYAYRERRQRELLSCPSESPSVGRAASTARPKTET